MGFYHDKVLPRVVEITCGSPAMAGWRRKATAGLFGTVLEIGFGSGMNVDVYPPEVEQVLAVEPSEVARSRSDTRHAPYPVPVDFVGITGESIPLDDDSCDSAVATFTLCTIPDVDQALSEIRRVLKPGGKLHFLEHGKSPDEGIHRWQKRLEPIQRRLGGGCHLTRQPVEMLEQASFEVEVISARYGKGPKPFTYFTAGTALSP